MRPVDLGGEEYRYEGDHGAYDDASDGRPPASPLSDVEREVVARFEAAAPAFPRWECRDCGTGWDSQTQAHCQLCHRQFATVGVSDKHHTYDAGRRPTCHDPATLRTKKGEPVFRLDGQVWRSYQRNESWGAA